MSPEHKQGRALGDILTPEPPQTRRSAWRLRLRNYFLTGLIIAAPLSITVYITWTIIGWIDAWVKPLVPDRYSPDHYLPFTLPGFGVIVAIVALTLLGAATANLFGRTIVRFGELMLDRMPLVRSVYRGLKQIFETVLSQQSATFQKVGLIEYPRRGLWSIVFVSTETRGELAYLAGGDTDEVYSVFLPTTPNPTSGYLLFVRRRDVAILDMTVEEAAKVVVSAGLVIPEREVTELAGDEALPRRDEPDDGASPPAGEAEERRRPEIAES